MIKIAVVGDIGSGKSYIAKLFGYPVFNADQEVASIYKNCLLYTSPSPRDVEESRMPSSA